MYFKMLKEYYSELSNSIIQYDGEIYQYVGDEVVITWNFKKGLSNNNCLRCFFHMKEQLELKSSKYKSKFGTIPTFKAGIHLGKVTSGEVGVIKKEITYTGDVLNTAARIQSLCNKYEVNLLVSEMLINSLNLENPYLVKEIGNIELRGKNEKIKLFNIIKKRTPSSTLGIKK